MYKAVHIMEINLGMLRKLRIKNFKRWKDAGMIEFVPVTVL